MGLYIIVVEKKDNNGLRNEIQAESKNSYYNDENKNYTKVH